MRTHLTTPGDVLKNKVLKGMNVTQEQLANALGVSRISVNQILNSRRSITAEMAVRLAYVLDTSAEMWLNLQAQIDLAEAKRELSSELPKLERLRSSKITQQ
ncbi:hypothetical protein AAW00_05890 [Aurantiacibacter luteus]|uniref:HTH cro/C1-type domain-containing protein n=2 Tax=Aurantiacibacter luteus TaxID=1581420 RepID=A0A0G9MZB1_9SPHN|nr:hypothetical protein AAW00_05890 [Aurantiacibacter luteus]